MSNMPTTPETLTPNPLTAVLYLSVSPGVSGYGCHGYTWSNGAPKKGYGVATHNLTPDGYVSKTIAKEQSITIDKYIDTIVNTTHVAAEELLVIDAIHGVTTWAVDRGLTNVLVITDSVYLLKIMNGWFNKWKSKKWLDQDGRPLPGHLLLASIDAINTSHPELKIKWRAANTEDALGIRKAATLAAIRLSSPTDGGDQQMHSVTYTEPDGYWKKDRDTPVLLAHNNMYMSVGVGTAAPTVYLTASTLDQLPVGDLGMRSSSQVYGVVIPNEVDQSVAMVYNELNKLSRGLPRHLLVNIGQLYAKDTSRYFELYGISSLVRPRPETMTFNTADDTEVIREINPPRLLFNMLDVMAEMRKVLDSYLNNVSPTKCVYTDITDTFFVTETSTKGKQKTPTTVTTLRDIKQTQSSVSIDIPWPSAPDGKLTVSPFLGVDTLTRNNLKRMETMEPKIILVMWPIAGGQWHKIATITKCNDGVAIWHNPWSCTVATP